MSSKSPCDPTAVPFDGPSAARSPHAAAPPQPRVDLSVDTSHQQPHQSISSSARPWPLDSARGALSLFFDPFSEEAAKCKRQLEAQLSKRGAYLPVVSTVAEATHVVLDVYCAASQWLRTGHRIDQHVVSLQWVKDSFLDGASADESLYVVVPDATGGEQGLTGGGSPGQAGDDPAGHLSDGEDEMDTSGPDESMESESEDEDEKLTRLASGRKRSARTRWTTEERKDLAVLLASHSPAMRAYEEFTRRHPTRTLQAALEHHRYHRSYFDSAIKRIQARHEEVNVKPGLDVTDSDESRMEVDDSTNYGPSAQSSRSVQPLPRVQEPEEFRLTGVAPVNLPSPDADWCFICGSCAPQRYAWINNLVGSKDVTGPDGEQIEVYERVGPKRACKSPCYSVYQAGVRGDKKSILARELPSGIEELERLGLLTERLLVRGMKKRRDVVEGKTA